jgi:hypothetical protein
LILKETEHASRRQAAIDGGHAFGLLTEWKESNLAFPFTLKTAFGEQKYVLNHMGDGGLLTYFKDSGHGHSGAGALVNVLLHRRHIMREQNAAFSRRPFEHFRVSFADESRILHTHDVQIVSAPQQPAQDAIVEILIGC